MQRRDATQLGARLPRTARQGAVPHDVSEHGEALPEDLFPVCDEEQGVDLASLPEAPIVEPGDNGLPGAGGHDDEVPMVSVDLAFDGELIEDLALVAPRANFECRDLERQLSWSSALDGEGFVGRARCAGSAGS